MLDRGRHLRDGNVYRGPSTTLRLVDFVFYPRTSPLFGSMSWAWTLAGQLHTQAVLPDPREANTPDVHRWFAVSNEVLAEVATGEL